MSSSRPHGLSPIAALVEHLDQATLEVLAERLRPLLRDPQGSVHLLDPKEAASRLGLSQRTVAKMARDGRLPGAIKVGRGWRIPEDQLNPHPLQADPIRPAAPTRAKYAPRSAVRAIREAA